MRRAPSRSASGVVDRPIVLPAGYSLAAGFGQTQLARLRGSHHGKQTMYSREVRYGLPDYTLWGADLNYQLTSRIKLHLSGDNLTDENLAELATYAQQEDQYRVGGTWWQWFQSCGDPHAVQEHGELSTRAPPASGAAVLETRSAESPTPHRHTGQPLAQEWLGELEHAAGSLRGRFRALRLILMTLGAMSDVVALRRAARIHGRRSHFKGLPCCCACSCAEPPTRST